MTQIYSVRLARDDGPIGEQGVDQDPAIMKIAANSILDYKASSNASSSQQEMGSCLNSARGFRRKLNALSNTDGTPSFGLGVFL